MNSDDYWSLQKKTNLENKFDFNTNYVDIDDLFNTEDAQIESRRKNELGYSNSAKTSRGPNIKSKVIPIPQNYRPQFRGLLTWSKQENNSNLSYEIVKYHSGANSVLAVCLNFTYPENNIIIGVCKNYNKSPIFNFNGAYKALQEQKQLIQNYNDLPLYAQKKINQHNLQKNLVFIQRFSLIKISKFFENIENSMNFNYDINQSNQYSHSELSITRTNKASDTAIRLIQKSVDVNKLNKINNTLLHSACKSGDLDTATLLIQMGSSTNEVSKYGTTSLYIACKNEHIDIARLLIREGANINKRNNNGGDTPLHMACKDGKLTFSNLLIQNGADINIKDKHGNTPLHIALTKNHLDIATLLIQKRNSELLYQSCLTGNLDQAKEALREGDIIDLHNSDGATPLIRASIEGHIDIVNLLLQKKANTELKSPKGWSALMYAAGHGYLDIVKALLKYGANRSTTDPQGRTAYDFAKIQNQEHIVNFLSGNMHPEEQGVKDEHIIMLLNQAEKKRNSELLYQSCLTGNLDQAKEALREGDIIDLHNSDGATPLIRASIEGHIDIVNLLLQKKANTELKSPKGWSALMYAAGHGYLDIVKALLKYDANRSTTDHQGRTAYDFAKIQNQEHIVSFLSGNMHPEEQGVKDEHIKNTVSKVYKDYLLHPVN